MVTVTTEALQAVKTALADFRTDVGRISWQARSRAQDIEEKCILTVSEARKDVQQAEEEIRNLEQKIKELDSRIHQIRKDVETTREGIAAKKRKVEELDSRIHALNRQAASLRRALSNAEDDKEKNGITSDIDQMERETRYCESEKASLMARIRDEENQMHTLEQELRNCNARREECQNELNRQKNRYEKLKDKLHRLQNVFSNLQSELREYIDAAKKFEITAENTAEKDKNAVERCIAYIDTYMSISL